MANQEKANISSILISRYYLGHACINILIVPHHHFQKVTRGMLVGLESRSITLLIKKQHEVVHLSFINAFVSVYAERMGCETAECMRMNNNLRNTTVNRPFNVFGHFP